MSFLNKSVNYSQTTVLKENILLPLLKLYNNFVLEKTGEFSISKDVNTGISYDYLIPNNNKKYYLLIMKKQLLEQQKSNSKYDILHFFPDQYNNDDDLLEKNKSSDFYLEVDSIFDDEFLLEGYLYKSDDKYEYLLTDILVKNKEIVNVSFELRYSLLNEIIQKIGKVCLNNHMSINIHPVFDDENQNLVKIFKNNFIYNTQIRCLEKVCNFTKRRYIDIKMDKIDKKNIEKGKYTDVYNVYNYETNNFEGILYIKGIHESQRMRILFNDKCTNVNNTNDTKVKINCIWNQVFSKWQPIFN
jgi:hypothetical protein